MTRIGKAFGLSLLAAFALSAFAAAGANAQGTITASAAGTVEATQTQAIGSEAEYFEAIGRKLECQVAHFKAHLQTKSESVTVTPDYTDHTQSGNCRAGGTLVTTVTENGCDYVFSGGKTVSGGSDYEVAVDVVCPAGQAIVVHVRNLLNTADACTITVGTQKANGKVTVRNTPATGAYQDDFDVQAAPGAVKVKSTVHSNNTAICGVEAGTSKEVETGYVVNTPLTLHSEVIQVTISD